MKYITIIRDSNSTFEIRYMETPFIVRKLIGGVFEHDLIKFIRDYFYEKETTKE